MKTVLILGGTNFIGRVLVERILQEQDIEVTLFNRGKTNPHLFPEVRKIHGDRDNGSLDEVFKENWDFIVDLSCYYPKSIGHVLEHLTKDLERYIFISTCSVYDNDQQKSVLRNEDAPILSCSEEQANDKSPSSYGNRKAECERLLIKSGIPYTIFRPALVFGEHDPTDRMYYWLHQVKSDEPLLLPNNGVSRFSVTYVHDLVDAIIKSMKISRTSETYNLITKPDLSISSLVEILAHCLGESPEPFNVSPEFLATQGVTEWTDIPLWINSDYFTYDNSRAIQKLDFTPTNLSQAIQETVAYFHSVDWPEPTYGISNKKKMELIEVWQGYNKTK